MLHTEFEKTIRFSVLDNLNALSNLDVEGVDPTAREVILAVIENLSENIKLFSEMIIDVLKQMDYKLLNDKGEFKKIGLLRWNNVKDYLEFAEFTRNKIKEMQNLISKHKDNTENIIAKT